VRQGPAFWHQAHWKEGGLGRSPGFSPQWTRLVAPPSPTPCVRGSLAISAVLLQECLPKLSGGASFRAPGLHRSPGGSLKCDFPSRNGAWFAQKKQRKRAFPGRLGRRPARWHFIFFVRFGETALSRRKASRTRSQIVGSLPWDPRGRHGFMGRARGCTLGLPFADCTRPSGRRGFARIPCRLVTEGQRILGGDNPRCVFVLGDCVFCHPGSQTTRFCPKQCGRSARSL